MRQRHGRPAGWSARQTFSYLLHNARAPDPGFDRTRMKDRLQQLLRERAETGKRVWSLGEESAQSLEEIDWDRTVAKQLAIF